MKMRMKNMTKNVEKYLEDKKENSTKRAKTFSDKFWRLIFTGPLCDQDPKST